MNKLFKRAALLAALAISTSATYAWEFYESTSASNGSDHGAWWVSVGASCSIKVTAGLSNPSAPIGGGSAWARVDNSVTGLIVSTAYYGSSSGSTSKTSNNQPAGMYYVTQDASAGGPPSAYATTRITW